MRFLKNLVLALLIPAIAIAQPAVTSIVAPAPVIQGITGKVGIYTQAPQRIELYTGIDSTARGFFLDATTGNLTGVGSAGLSSAGSLTFTGTDPNTAIFTNSNAKRLLLYGGTSAANTHANIQLNASTFSGTPGDLNMTAGAVTNGKVVIAAPDAAGVINLAVGGFSTTRWQIGSGGQLFQDATNGGGIITPRTNVTNIFGAASQDADVSASAGTGGLQVSNNAFGIANQLSLVANGANGTGVNLWTFKTRSTADDANTIINAGDTLLNITALGADGASYRRAGTIAFESDATPGASDMPGRIVFSTTPDGAAASVERLRISSNGSIGLERTNTAGGTTGAQTINKMAGSVNMAAAASSLVVTNSLVATTSNVFCGLANNDASLKSVACTPAAGSFTINGNAAATAETRIIFLVTN